MPCNHRWFASRCIDCGISSRAYHISLITRRATMPTRYPFIGDLDKPFHRPECECDRCEDWRDEAYAQRDESLTSIRTVKFMRDIGFTHGEGI